MTTARNGFRKRANSVLSQAVAIQRLESRVLLSTFSNADLNGTFALQTMGGAGTVFLDGNGNITGGFETHDDGTTDVPSGTYSVAADGSLTIGIGSSANLGAVNSSKNVAAASRPSNNSLGLIVSGAGATFSDADVKGTWYLFDNGDGGPPDNYPTSPADNTGHATVVLDGAGGFTYTHVTDESGNTETGAGVYNVSPTGAVTVNITSSSNPGSNLPSFAGQMNSSKDLVAMDTANLPGAAALDSSRLILMVQPSGSYSDSSMQGSWALETDNGNGTITFDGSGNIGGSFTSTNNSGGIQTDSVTGTYNVSADGSFTINPITSGQSSPMPTVSGWIDASNNVAVAGQPNSGAKGLDDLAVLINSSTPLAATVSLQSSSPTAAPGSAVTFTATVSPLRLSNNPLGGTVNFFDGATQIGSAPVLAVGTAALTTSALPEGSHSITANYTGDTAYAPAVSAAAGVLVSAAKTIGQLDPTFGTKGIASHAVGFTNTSGVAPDGAQSVLIGTVGTAPNEMFGVTRYNADGTLDTAFGNAGVVNTSFGSTDDVPSALTVLPGGQILVAGTASSTGSEFAIAEYNADGSMDTSFGSGSGQVLVSFSNAAGMLANDVLKSMVVGPDGIIYLGGRSDAAGTTDFAIAAMNADGSPDTNFNSTGKLLQDFSGGSDALISLALQTNGDLVAAGSAAVAGTTQAALARFLPSGNLDGRFGIKGLVTTNVRGEFDSASSVLIQPQGQIIIGGVSATGSGDALTSDFLLARYTPTGKIDKSFGGGPVITSFGQPSAVTQLVLQSNGGIVASGKTTASLTVASPLNVALARYTIKGLLDTTFNGTGKTVVDFSGGAVGSSSNNAAAFGDVLVQPVDASSLGSAFDQFISSSQGVVATTQGGAILSAGNNGSNTIEARLITAGVDLVASLLSAVPSAVIGGAKGTVSVQIAESGTNVAAGSVTINLEFATDAQGDGAVTVKAIAERINLRQQKTHAYRLAFVYPQNLTAGSYYLIASVDNGTVPTLKDLNIQNNIAASAAAISIAPPSVALVASAVTTKSTFTPGKPIVASFTVINTGNVPAKGTTTADVILSIDPTPNDGTTEVVSKLAVGIVAKKNRVYRVSFKLPKTTVAGSYYLIVVVDPVNSLGTVDHSDSTAIDPAPATVG